MINRLIFFAGIGTGYVLGARAGRKRYEGIARASRSVWSSEPVQRGVREAQSVLDEKGPVVVERTVETAREVADFVGHAVQGAAVAVGRTAHSVGERIGTTTQDVAGRVGSTTQDIAGRVGDTAKDLGTRTADQTKHVVDRVGQQATEVGHRVAETAEDVRDRVVETAEEARTRVQATAEDLRERGEEAGRRAVFSAAEARDEALASFDDEDETGPVGIPADGAARDGEADASADESDDDADEDLDTLGPDDLGEPADADEQPVSEEPATAAAPARKATRTPKPKPKPKAAPDAAGHVPTPADIAGSVHREETAHPTASDASGTTPARTADQPDD
ncbi:Apolipoprotein A1/A4/E domain protein [Clavibacter michiganensis]|uniref:Apolipoprotein A1/A4/E domain protein n=1 Tax=Clavibacter michiganensis TaxID=28447 RepID=A0A251XVS7_9MICO|nr:Apolipoprotein A1/A4/E domain protein [Clavibacter michiganensis]